MSDCTSRHVRERLSQVVQYANPADFLMKILVRSSKNGEVDAEKVCDDYDDDLLSCKRL